jgi:hypothetical protein
MPMTKEEAERILEAARTLEQIEREERMNARRTDHPEYVEFPRLMWLGGETLTVKNAEQKADALAQGWFLTEKEALDAATAPKADKAKK